MSNIEIKTVKFNNNEMDYFTFGTGKKVFVMLPGLSAKSVMLSAAGIASAYRMFAGDFTVYVFDRTKFLTENYTIAMLAEDTAQAMKALGLSECYIFGASQGGMMAQCIAIHHPELVKKLLLASTASRVSDETKAVFNTWLKAAECHDSEKLCDVMLDVLYGAQFSSKFGEFIRLLHKDLSAEQFERFLLMAKTFDDFNTYDSLEEIKCPVLVIGAENDKIFSPRDSADIAEKLGGELYIYGGGYGHCVFDEAPDYKDRIMKFFSDGD